MMIANSFILIASIMQFLAVLLYIPILLIIGEII